MRPFRQTDNDQTTCAPVLLWALSGIFITNLFPALPGYGSRNSLKEQFYMTDVASTGNSSFQETGQEHGVFQTYHVYLKVLRPTWLQYQDSVSKTKQAKASNPSHEQINTRDKTTRKQQVVGESATSHRHSTVSH